MTHRANPLASGQELERCWLCGTFLGKQRPMAVSQLSIPAAQAKKLDLNSSYATFKLCDLGQVTQPL